MKTWQDLRNEKDIMVVFRNFELLTQYVRTAKDLTDAMILYLEDNQKLEVMEQDYFKNLSKYSKTKVVMTIVDKQIKNQIIHNPTLLEEIFDQYDFVQFLLLSTSDESKMYVLNNPEILAKFNISKWDMKVIITSMSNEARTELLQNKGFIQQLGLNSFDITELIAHIEDDEIKYKLVDDYELDEFNKSQVIKSFSDENKERIILEDKHGLSERYITEIIGSLGTDKIVEFINNHQDFLQGKDIKPFRIIKSISVDKQSKLVEQIPGMQITEGEKRRIFASLKNETKQAVDLQRVDEKYRKLLGMELSEDYRTKGQIILKLDDDMTQYKDLDELLTINALEMVKSDQERKQFLKLCEICPNLEIVDNLLVGVSTGEEYIQGEEWVSSVTQGIQEDWTDVQKLAYIDTTIGKKISYTPDFGTEVEESEDARALWKIIASGYGVCNGIAQVEQYLLGRAGIEAELVSGKHHTFVKVKNIEIPTENGTIKGDTLVDPTWNLTASRYGGMPQHFCKGYDELRKVDIDGNGIDHECHKSDDLAQYATINMSTETLREVYKSIGIADQHGKFPIGKLMEQSTKIDETYNDMSTKINQKFALLKKWCPEFATCQNSTIEVLSGILFENNEKFEFKRCIASRVYDKQDSKKQAVLYVYMEIEGQGKQFFYADKEAGEFIAMSQEEFEAKFECYEADMEKMPGNKRPWETSSEIQEKKQNSSGQITSEEGR